MNREVHYIFSIQTQDYLKSAWERGRRVYLMISPIAQCRADASGNFRKAVARGDRTAASCLSNLQNTSGLIKRKARNNNNYDVIGAASVSTFELSTQTNSHTAIHTSSTRWTDVSQFFFSNILALHLRRTSVHSEVLCMQSSLEQHMQHPATNTSLLWLVMCVHIVYINTRAKTITSKGVLKAQESRELS